MKHLLVRGARSLVVFAALLVSTTFITFRGAHLKFQLSSSGPYRSDGFHLDGDNGFRISDRELRRAIQYEGTGDRIRRFLDKARSGEGFTVSVVGGSGGYPSTPRMSVKVPWLTGSLQRAWTSTSRCTDEQPHRRGDAVFAGESARADIRVARCAVPESE